MMEDLIQQIPFILNWVKDEPFRLFAVLSLALSVVVFLFFRGEHALYRVFATIMLFGGTFSIGYALVADPTKQGMLESAFSEQELKDATKENLMNVASNEACLATSEVKYKALMTVYPDDKTVQRGYEVAVILAKAQQFSKQALRLRYLKACESGGGIAGGWSSSEPTFCASAKDELKTAIRQFQVQSFSKAMVSGLSAQKLLQLCDSNR